MSYTDSKVVRSIPVKVAYEKREPINLTISLTDSFSLRDEIKKHLKLQVPARELTLSLKPFDTGKDNINLDQCSPRKQMSIEEEKQFLKQIQVANTIIYAVCAAFEIGDYICTGNELGSGAFSQVYRGYHKTTKQPAAIKVVDYSSLNTSKAIEYHTNERKILQSLDSHENIVKLYDLLERIEGSSKYIYFVLEYCDGGSLDNYIRKKPLSEHQVRRFMLQLANGLTMLEKNNIIHRDLKPQNLLLTSKNMDEAILKVCDFGFGRYYTTEDLIVSFPGTPLYESPDTLLSKPYNDNASDIWAMGAIFYEMLTGKVLFSNVRTMVELKAAINQEPSKYLIFPKEVEGNISRDCRDLLFKLMEKDSRKRITLPNILKHPFLESSAKKMIYSAKDGLGFAIEITQPISVAELRVALASHSKIAKENILLLLDGGQELTDSKELREDFPPKGQAVFLFDKSAILPSLDIKPVSIQNEEELEIPAISVEDRPFTELIKYKYKFANVYIKQKAYLQTCQKAYKLFEDSLPVLWVQIKSLKALLVYFNMDTSALDMEIKSLESEMSAKNSLLQNILANFESVLFKMKSVPLYGVHNSNSKTLIDVADERQTREQFANFKIIFEDLRKFIENAHTVHRRISEKPDYSEIFNVYESKTSSPVHLKDTLRANVNFLQATVDTMYQNYLKVVSELDKAKKLSSTTGIRRDVTDCIEEMSKINDTHFSQAVDLEKMMNSMLIQVLSLRSRVMAGITAIFDIKKQSQYVSQNIESKSFKLNELLKISENLRKVMEMPKAHEDFLFELQRRANFHALFAKKATFANNVLRKMIDEESSRIKLFKLRMSDILPVKVFPEIQQESYAAVVNINVPLAPSVPANIVDDDDGFTELLSERKDYDQIIAENKRLVEELTKALEEKKDISTSLSDSSSMREDISKLKLKYEQDKAKQLEYMDEYDRRVAADKARIRELEDREKTMATKLSDMEKLLGETQFAREKNSMKEMVEAQAKIAELEEKVSTLQNELKKESTVRLQSSQGIIKERSEMNKQLEDAINRAEAKTKELKEVNGKYEALLAKTGLMECPFCLQMMAAKDVQEHIDKKHS